VPEGIAEIHKPYFAHAARTCSLLANLPCAAADFEAAMAARSSTDSGLRSFGAVHELRIIRISQIPHDGSRHNEFAVAAEHR
jgi:hypothetical protein